MKALSLWQPWASLVVRGLKAWETRSWPTNHRGLLAIHASKRPAAWVGVTEGFHDVERFARIYRRLGGGLERFGLPRGALIGWVTLTDCVPTETLLERGGLSSDELDAGGFAPGRFAWRLEGAVEADRPVRFKGRQGLFEVPPDWREWPDGKRPAAPILEPSP